MEERPRKGSNLGAISHTAKHGRSNVNSRKLPATGRWMTVPGNGSNLAAISHSAKHGRYESSSWKLPAAGRWKNVPGKVQISMQSHSILWNMGEHMSVPGNFPQWGDGRRFRERFKYSSHISCGIRVNFAILKLDIAGSLDENASTL